MDDRQRRENERNIRVKDFLSTNLHDFAQNAVAQEKITFLAEKVSSTQLEHQKQISGDDELRHELSIVRDAHDELLGAMRDVRDFAQSMAEENPSLENRFRLPRHGGRLALISSARAFASDAEDYKRMFIDYGMDADFIIDLRTKADALEEALAEADASLDDRIGETDTIEQEISQANKMVEILDPIVRRAYRDNPTKLAAWVYASHVERYAPKPRLAKLVK